MMASLPYDTKPLNWTVAELLLIGPLGTNFIEILIWFKEIYLKMPFASFQPFCPHELDYRPEILEWNVIFYYHELTLYRGISSFINMDLLESLRG